MILDYPGHFQPMLFQYDFSRSNGPVSDRERVGGAFYVAAMIDRWAWLAHSPQMC